MTSIAQSLEQIYDSEGLHAALGDIPVQMLQPTASSAKDDDKRSTAVATTGRQDLAGCLPTPPAIQQAERDAVRRLLFAVSLFCWLLACLGPCCGGRWYCVSW